MRPLHVLLVTYSFPPAGGVGVLRAASLAGHLPAAGLSVDVLTAANAAAVGSDKALLKNIPAEVHVHRTFTLDLPFSLKKRVKQLVSGRVNSVERRFGSDRSTRYPQTNSAGAASARIRKLPGFRSLIIARASSSPAAQLTL